MSLINIRKRKKVAQPLADSVSPSKKQKCEQQVIEEKSNLLTKLPTEMINAIFGKLRVDEQLRLREVSKKFLSVVNTNEHFLLNLKICYDIKSRKSLIEFFRLLHKWKSIGKLEINFAYRLTEADLDLFDTYKYTNDDKLMDICFTQLHNHSLQILNFFSHTCGTLEIQKFHRKTSEPLAETPLVENILMTNLHTLIVKCNFNTKKSATDLNAVDCQRLFNKITINRDKFKFFTLEDFVGLFEPVLRFLHGSSLSYFSLKCDYQTRLQQNSVQDELRFASSIVSIKNSHGIFKELFLYHIDLESIEELHIDGYACPLINSHLKNLKHFSSTSTPGRLDIVKFPQSIQSITLTQPFRSVQEFDLFLANKFVLEANGVNLRRVEFHFDINCRHWLIENYAQKCHYLIHQLKNLKELCFYFTCSHRSIDYSLDIKVPGSVPLHKILESLKSIPECVPRPMIIVKESL